MVFVQPRYMSVTCNLGGKVELISIHCGKDAKLVTVEVLLEHVNHLFWATCCSLLCLIFIIFFF